MPVVDINVIAGRSPEKRAALVEAIRQGVLESLQVEPEALSVWLREFPEECVACAGRPGGKRMTLRLTCFAGRSPDVKRMLYRSLAEHLLKIGEDPARCVMTVVDSPLENWGILGGKCAADVFADAGGQP